MNPLELNSLMAFLPVLYMSAVIGAWLVTLVDNYLTLATGMLQMDDQRLSNKHLSV
mgnify:CR=1 FL=1